MADLKSFLDALGLGQHADVLAQNDIDLEVLPDLTDEDLAGLGLSLGHRRKLMAAVKRGVAAAPTLAPAPAPAAVSQAERRQVTVLFADLVGSTALARKLDPEDMARLVRQYQDACAGVIARFDGFLAKFMGDGVLAYFGYPQAHEDSAERAARAGLAIVEAVGKIDGGTMAARIGIATGMVVVGEIIGSGTAQEQTIVGDTPNLAARLQGLAEPNAVLVAGITRRLLGELFDYEFLGEQRLKGIDTPLGVWRVLRESEIGTRFSAVRERGTLVGREQEIALLVERWQHARAGEGQVVLLSGEAGIGKSRLVEALIERMQNERHVRVRMQCSPYHRNTALYPVMRHLAEAAGFAAEDSVAAKREKLRSMLAAASPLTPRAMGVLASAMGLGDDPAIADLSAAQQKSELMSILTERLVALASEAPVLLLLEDAQWLDPTTRELFDGIVDRIERAPALVVVTHRPDFVPPWTGRPFVTALAFNRLSGHDCAAIAANIATVAVLSKELIEEILRRSDGVPLYVEELTKAVLEGGLTQTSQTAVPPTLQDSLMARLDRLGKVKDVAQAAAVIGREFTRDLLAVIAADNALDESLEKLVIAGLVFPRGNRADGRYSFKHALVQEAAYDSLLRARRQVLHTDLAKALVATGGAESEPEVAAHHFARAGNTDEASRHWTRAGDRALAQSSYNEAIASYEAAIDCARQLEAGAARDRRVLDILLKLGPALIVAKGYGSDTFGICYREAQALAQALDDRHALFTAGWGLWMNDGAQQRFDLAAKRADELIAIAAQLDDDDLKLEATHCRWATALFGGDTVFALKLSAEGAAQYDPVRHHRLTASYGGHDAGVCANSVLATSLAVVGRETEARAASRAAMDLSERLGHPNSRAHALANAIVVTTLHGDIEGCTRIAGELQAMAPRYDIAFAGMVGGLGTGWLRLRAGDADGLLQMEEAFKRRSSMMPTDFYNCTMMADGFAMAGRPNDALAVIDQALERAAKAVMGFYVSELWRWKGELALMLDASDRATAEAAFARAARTAEGQGATILHLRAVTSLARLWGDSGKRDAAREMLAPLHARFTEGFETPALSEAAAVLAGL